MLTIFSCPKEFKGHIGIIQRNAIKSWLLLNPRPEILLFGNERGIKSICREFDLNHLPDVDCSAYGTPLINDMFKKAQKIARNRFLCYVNSDIIFFQDFIEAFRIVSSKKKNFLMVGRRYSLNIKNHLNFNRNWEKDIKKRIVSERLNPPWAIDYFIFNNGFFEKIPPLVVGRSSWDNWIIYNSVSKRKNVIDATKIIKAIHQRHDYSHLTRGKEFYDSETLMNRRIVGEYKSAFTVDDSKYVLTKNGLKRNFHMNINRVLGRAGIFLREHSPKLYFKLKKLKNGFEGKLVSYTGR